MFQLLLPLVFEIFEIFRFWDFSCSMEGMRKVMAAWLYLIVLKLQFLLKFVTFFRCPKLLHLCSNQRTRKKKFIFKSISLDSMGPKTYFKHTLFFVFFFFGTSKNLLSSNPQFSLLTKKHFFLIYLLSSMGSKTHFKHIIFS